MRLNAERSQWEVELELPAGKHAFKFILVPPVLVSVASLTPRSLAAAMFLMMR